MHTLPPHRLVEHIQEGAYILVLVEHIQKGAHTLVLVEHTQKGAHILVLVEHTQKGAHILVLVEHIHTPGNLDLDNGCNLCLAVVVVHPKAGLDTAVHYSQTFSPLIS